MRPCEDYERVLGWSLLHSVGMVLAAAVAWFSGDVRIAAVFGAASLFVLAVVRAGSWTPTGAFGAANAVTVLRVALILGFSTVSAPGFGPAALLIVIFALDGLDGYIARRPPDSSSAFGAEFDMETDALLVLVAGLVLRQTGRLGAFIVIPGLLRYVYAIVIRVLPPSRGEAPRSRLGRYAFSAMVVSLVLSTAGIEPVHRPVAVLATLLIVLSFARSAVWSLGLWKRSAT